MAWQGFVLSVLWGMFFVPAFHAPPLTVGYAIGVALTAKLFAGDSLELDGEEKSNDELLRSLFRGMFSLLIYLLIGVAIKTFFC
jgi:hypothetical protein